MDRPILPPELSDTIIDFLHTDVPSLAACGLVCRAWAPASRYHLYAAIFLTPSNVAAFDGILSKAPALAFVVREVQIRFADSSVGELVRVLGRLPRTTRVAFRPTKDEVSRRLTAALLAPIVGCGPGRLDIRHMVFDFKSRFDSLRQVVDLICLCPNVVSLELGGSWLRMGDAHPDAVSPLTGWYLPSTLRTLTLTCDLDYLLQWLLQLQDGGPPISTLILHHIVRREVPAIAAYLAHAGATLTSLALMFRDNDAPGRLATRVDLALNPNLRSLALEGTAPNILACLLNVRVLPRVRRLETLELTLRHAVYYPDAMRVMEDYPWALLDRALSASASGDSEGSGARLRSVKITVVDSLTRHELGHVREWVWGRLPRAREMYCSSL
uniref:F-box domain-containing protein n=1 Tax=Mycena chlorophos TaxID=658473 RepID=A0ABQ0LKU1_MYCCL|nr:predicted protein [Mycena chlorophos]